MELIGLMNDTKWDELRLAMYRLGTQAPRWRTCCKDNGHVSAWDGEWFYHFRNDGYGDIAWVEIQTGTASQHALVHACIKAIHLPGEQTKSGFIIYGYLPVGTAIDYL